MANEQEFYDEVSYKNCKNLAKLSETLRVYAKRQLFKKTHELLSKRETN